MDLMNNINNKTTMLWQIITKVFTSTMAETTIEIGDNIAGVDNFLQLRLTQIGMEFLPTLFDDIQTLAKSQ